MAGIYIHIPFCKKTCSYCDFYKTTAVAILPAYIQALCREMEMQRTYLDHEEIETLYIGGGTPSLLSISQINLIISAIYKHYQVAGECEITLEANPDDLSMVFLKELLLCTPINRLSIGIQSFSDRDLQLLNRRHSAAQSLRCISNAHEAGFRNLSIDLIYGIPGLTVREWQDHVEKALEAEHISAYHLTVEQGTRLSKMVSEGKTRIVSEDISSDQFKVLCELTHSNEFIHYEISNFAKQGLISRHNSNYWLQKKYLGLGPSAHSYDLVSRQWNIRDIKKYIRAINTGDSFYELEKLTPSDCFNEYLMVSLRTMWGVDSLKIIKEFGDDYFWHFKSKVGPYIKSGQIILTGNKYTMTSYGWLISDFILSKLFI